MDLALGFVDLDGRNRQRRFQIAGELRLLQRDARLQLGNLSLQVALVVGLDVVLQKCQQHRLSRHACRRRPSLHSAASMRPACPVCTRPKLLGSAITVPTSWTVRGARDSAVITVRTESRCCVALGTNRLPSAMRCGTSVAMVAGTDGKVIAVCDLPSTGSSAARRKQSGENRHRRAPELLHLRLGLRIRLTCVRSGRTSPGDARRRRATLALISSVNRMPTISAPTPKRRVRAVGERA